MYNITPSARYIRGDFHFPLQQQVSVTVRWSWLDAGRELRWLSGLIQYSKSISVKTTGHSYHFLILKQNVLVSPQIFLRRV